MGQRKADDHMKVLIVGGVAGGAGAAARLRRNDEHAQIILFEKSGYISFANCGLPYYIGNVIVDRDDLLIQTPESFHARFNVDVRVSSEVISVNTKDKTITVNDLKSNRTYVESYDALVLSPGAKPVRPNSKGIDSGNVFTLRNVEDTFKIKDFVTENKPKSCAVIGGGYIGLEMADNLHNLGMKVSIVEAASHVIATLDEDMAHDVHNHIRSKGVALHLNSKVTEIDDGFVTTENGKRVDAELVIMSVGVKPETGFLQGSGIEFGSRGEILVDEYLETSAEGVFAVGDAICVKDFVSGRNTLIPLASPANKQARIVADNITGKKAPYKGTQGTAIAKVFDMTVAMTGQSETALKNAGAAYKKSYTYSLSNAGYYPGGEPMFIKLLYQPESGNLLGAQITGTKGVDKRIDQFAATLRYNGTVYDLEELELAYAPPFSSAKDPVNMAGYVAENVLTGKSDVFYVEDIPSIPKDATLLDVRTGGEFKKGSFDGAVNISVDTLRDNLEKLDKAKPIYAYCQIGLRGYIAEQILRQNGFKVKNLSGGYRLYNAMKKDR
jgi:NADPH-dependent 2,4-dienoyl-CoA reductase/sulfur reductase-like enzyme/rhodanese-related sulfurtransferase